MHQPVQDCHCHRVVAEALAPVLHDAVRLHHDATLDTTMVTRTYGKWIGKGLSQAMRTRLEAFLQRTDAAYGNAPLAGQIPPPLATSNSPTL